MASQQIKLQFILSAVLLSGHTAPALGFISRFSPVRSIQARATSFGRPSALRSRLVASVSKATAVSAAEPSAWDPEADSEDQSPEAQAIAAEWLADASAELMPLVNTPAAVDALRSAVLRAPPGMDLPAELFSALFPFQLDEFQLQALRALGRRRNVVVSAPTGSGKTVAGELAIYYALALGLRVFYTTPLKALSNQKFSDFRKQYGAERVGLLTGDSGVNRDAQVVVMTTEVYRNMLYESGKNSGGPQKATAAVELRDVFAVVFDEFHYMNDPSRGTVWEESVISSPTTLQMIALSATVSNVDDIVGWFNSTHGPTELVASDFRPVPLRYHFATSAGVRPLFKDKDAGPGALKAANTFAGRNLQGRRRSKRGGQKRWAGAELNPELRPQPDFFDADDLRSLFDQGPNGSSGGGRNRNSRGSGGGYDRSGSRSVSNANSGYANSRGTRGGRGGSGGGGGRTRAPNEVPSFPYLARCLGRADMLPAIVFIFSRNGCDRAAMEVARQQSVSLTPEESAELNLRLKAFEAATAGVAEVEPERLALLRAGVGIHHAGLLPLHKSLVEDLFNAGLVKICFATETLAAGVNMPARTTVISTLSKRTDNGVGPLQVAQLLQMAGRAGRRGKDVQGSVVLMRSRYEDATRAHQLLLSPIDAIDSHFRSSYGMVSTILRRYSPADARALVERSFGSYLTSPEAQRQREVLQQAATSSSSVVSTEEGLGEDDGGGSGVKIVGKGGSGSMSASPPTESLSEQEAMAWQVSTLAAKLEAMTTVLQGFDLSEVKAYAKLRQRLDSELRIAKYLRDQRAEQEAAVMEQSVLPFARLGAGILLKDGLASSAFSSSKSNKNSNNENGNNKGSPPDALGLSGRVGALLGDAPSSFAGRQVPLWLVLLKPKDETTTTKTSDSEDKNTDEALGTEDDDDDEEVKLVLVEARHVAAVDSSDESGLRPAIAVSLAQAVVEDARLAPRRNPALSTGTSAGDGNDVAGAQATRTLAWKRGSGGVWAATAGQEGDALTHLVQGISLGAAEAGGGGISDERSEEGGIAPLPASQSPLTLRDVTLRVASFDPAAAGLAFGVSGMSGEVAAQEALAERVKTQLSQHPLHEHPQRDEVINAGLDVSAVEAELRQAAQRMERAARLQNSAENAATTRRNSREPNRGSSGSGSGGGSGNNAMMPSAAWLEFEAVKSVLEAYGAIAAPQAESSNPTSSSKSSKAVAAAAVKNDEEEAARLADELFDLCDADGDGSISRLELFGALEESPTMLDALYPSAADTRSSTSTSNGRANSNTSPPEASAVRLTRAADVLIALDGDGDGEVSREELRTAFIGAANAANAAASDKDNKNAVRASNEAMTGDAAPSPAAAAAPAVVNANPVKGSALSPLGDLVASLNGENELWLALVLRSEGLTPLSSSELAGLIAAVVVEYSRPDLYALYGPSDAVLDACAVLKPEADALLARQAEAGISAPVGLDPRLSGLVESWADGYADWGQLCASTSLDQGDLCRVLRRTMEVLRSLCLSSSLSSGLRDKARKAMDSLDRAPVTDDSYLTLQQSATVTDAASEEASEEEVPGDDGDEEEEEEECEEEGP